jgi:hypothetical protein
MMFKRLGRPMTPRFLMIVGLIALLILAVRLASSSKSSDESIALPSSQELPSTSLGSPIHSPRARDLLVYRLREILRIREKAYQSRDADILRSIYSEDCPCLASDEAAIRGRLSRGYIWDGIATSLNVKNVFEVNSRLWVVTARFRSEILNIRTEDGRLIRTEPAGSDLLKFTLVMPREGHDWLLGIVSVLEGG